MKKVSVLWIILDLIFLIIFNAFFFALGGVDHNASVWISYGFIHFAYLMLLITPILIRGKKSSAVFGFSLYAISSVYFLFEFVTGVMLILVFTLVSMESVKAALLVQVFITGLYGIVFVSYLIANERTAEAEEKQQHQIAYIKEASVKLKNLLENISDKEARKKIERVYDTLYSSPVKSPPALSQLENSILASIYALEKAVYSGDTQSVISLADPLLNAVNERNNRLKRFA